MIVSLSLFLNDFLEREEDYTRKITGAFFKEQLLADGMSEFAEAVQKPSG